jgi:uncharacterized membrane protein
MHWSFRLVRIFGIEIKIHVTFFLLLAWIGWLMALVGWGIQTRRAPSDGSQTSLSRADEIARLDALRHRNVITDEEFQKEKRRLLDQPS